MTKHEFRKELDERLRGRRYNHMPTDQYIQITLEVALDLMIDTMVNAGVLKDSN